MATTLKLLIIGEAGVGKTSLIMRFIDNSFAMNTLSTIGIDYKTKETEMDGKPYRI
jgi:GTPase SAR1 family protein